MIAKLRFTCIIVFGHFLNVIICIIINVTHSERAAAAAAAAPRHFSELHVQLPHQFHDLLLARPEG